MMVIPVIDLKDGYVARARGGQRENYAPNRSLLCDSSDVFRVIEAFLGIYHFTTIYIADLNALTGHGNHDALIAKVVDTYRDIVFWVDAGFVAAKAMRFKPENFFPVLGSESISDATLLDLLHFKRRFILSLDYFGEQERGPRSLFDSSRYWPKRVIIMTLGRVGSDRGPDYERLGDFRTRYPATDFIAAGGVRDAADLLRLQKLGISAVLLASALHDRSLAMADLGAIATA